MIIIIGEDSSVVVCYVSGKKHTLIAFFINSSFHRQNDNGWMGYCDKRTTTYVTRDSPYPICWVGRYEQTQKSKIVQHPQNNNQTINRQKLRRKNEEL